MLLQTPEVGTVMEAFLVTILSSMLYTNALISCGNGKVLGLNRLETLTLPMRTE